jgi:NADPH:quinone reductase-like Zn-dependent oxidoreductase
VSLFALQFARLFGAQVIATTGNSGHIVSSVWQTHAAVAAIS